jgi:hypothetical protein
MMAAYYVQPKEIYENMCIFILYFRKNLSNALIAERINKSRSYDSYRR